jgi:subtilisin family serine protease
MATMSSRTSHAGLAIAVCFAGVFCWSPCSADASRDVIVMFRPGVVSLLGSSIGGPLDSVVISPWTTANTLRTHRVLRLDKANPSFTLADTLQESRAGDIVTVPNEFDIYVLTLEDTSLVAGLVDSLEADPWVVFAERNGELPPSDCPPDPVPNDLKYQDGFQWNLNNCFPGFTASDISAPEAWEITTGSPSVKIGLVDHGIYRPHPDFAGRIISGDTIIDDAHPTHGTHVGGIFAATSNNLEGITAVDWHAEINNQTTFVFFDSRGNGIEDAVDHGDDIINMSFGGNAYSSYIHLQIARAYKLDRYCVASADDDGPDYEYYFPGDIHMTTSVGSINQFDERYSNRSHFLDVVAPGSAVWTTHPGFLGNPSANYTLGNGTSIATPHVSAVAALLLSVNPSLSNDDLKGIIKASAVNIGSADEFGAGRVNAFRALQMLEAPYSISPLTASGGAPYGDQAPLNAYRFFSFPDLADGIYYARRQEVRKHINFPFPPYATTPVVWGRKTSVGCSADIAHFNEGFCEPVEGTVTRTGCDLRTFVYELWNVAGQYVGWVPSSPGSQTFKYSVLGIKDLHAPVVSVIYPNGGETFGTGQTVSVQWHVDDEFLEGTLSDIYLIDENAQIAWTIAQNQHVDSEGNGAFSWRIWTGAGTINTHKIRIITTDSNYNGGDDYSDGCFTVMYSSKGGPVPPNPCIAPCGDAPLETQVTTLGQNVPNPFNPQTRIPYSIGRRQWVTLRVYAVNGALVRNLYEGPNDANYYELSWDGTNDRGEQQASGVYFAVLATQDAVLTRKMVLLR